MMFYARAKRHLSSALLLSLVASAQAQTNGGEDVPRVNGPWFKSPANTLAAYRGNCTWYAWGRAAEATNGLWKIDYTHDAKGWFDGIKNGRAKDSTPEVGAIMCLDQLSAQGHVAYVVQVNGYDSWVIEQYNVYPPKGLKWDREKVTRQYRNGKPTGMVLGERFQATHLAGFVHPPVRRRVVADYDGDGKTDYAVWRKSEGKWYIQPSSGASGYTVKLGQTGDILVPADYNGDGKTDPAVYRPSERKWYIQSSTGLLTVGFGNPGDVPVVADYDGDGKADIAMYRPSEHKWYINLSSGGGKSVGFGNTGDVLVPADYDGDGKADLAVYRPSEGKWYIQFASGGGLSEGFGNPKDVTVPADYDGDGKTDYAVWRPSERKWYVVRSHDGGTSEGFGNPGDYLVPGDYDGDGKTDYAVWRPSEGKWYVVLSSGGSRSLGFGNPGDVPAR